VKVDAELGVWPRVGREVVLLRGRRRELAGDWREVVEPGRFGQLEGLTTEERRELSELRRENRRLREDVNHHLTQLIPPGWA
jgi:hypothetical protein